MLREPPNNIQAEQAILGAILIDNNAFHRVSDWLTEEHFYEPGHARIFAAIKRLVTGGRRALPASLKGDVAELKFGETPGPAYLGHLAAGAPPPRHAGDYARTVYDLALRRKMVEIGEDLIEQAMSAPIEASPDTLIETAEGELSTLAERGHAKEHQLSAGDASIQAINLIAAAYQRDGGMAGLSTGLLDLDGLIGGLAPSDLVIAAGRPSMGKTALALGIAYHCARRYAETKHTDAVEGCPVGFFTLEMSAQQIMLRLIAYEAHIPSSKLRRGDIESADFDRIIESCQNRIATAPLHFDEAGGISIAQLAARARRMKRQHKIGLLVVDYLQLMSGTRRREGRTQEVSEITAGLKSIAKELEIPVLALSQLSREVEKREGQRPQLSDLRESGSIEQDADVVMFVYREQYYIERREPKKESAQHDEWRLDLEKVRGKAELIIEKQRQGPTGTVELRFNAPLTQFSNLAKQERLPEQVGAL